MSKLSFPLIIPHKVTQQIWAVVKNVAISRAVFLSTAALNSST